MKSHYGPCRMDVQIESVLQTSTIRSVSFQIQPEDSMKFISAVKENSSIEMIELFFGAGNKFNTQVASFRSFISENTLPINAGEKFKKQQKRRLKLLKFTGKSSGEVKQLFMSHFTCKHFHCRYGGRFACAIPYLGDYFNNGLKSLTLCNLDDSKYCFEQLEKWHCSSLERVDLSMNEGREMLHLPAKLWNNVFYFNVNNSSSKFGLGTDGEKFCQSEGFQLRSLVTNASQAKLFRSQQVLYERFISIINVLRNQVLDPCEIQFVEIEDDLAANFDINAIDQKYSNAKKYTNATFRGAQVSILEEKFVGSRSLRLHQDRPHALVSSHPNILPLFGVAPLPIDQSKPKKWSQDSGSQKCWTVKSIYEDCQLTHLLQRNEKCCFVSDDVKLYIITCVASAMAHLQDCQVVHRDLTLDAVKVGATLEDIYVGNFSLALQVKDRYRSAEDNWKWFWSFVYDLYSYSKSKEKLEYPTCSIDRILELRQMKEPNQKSDHLPKNLKSLAAVKNHDSLMYVANTLAKMSSSPSEMDQLLFSLSSDSSRRHIFNSLSLSDYSEIKSHLAKIFGIKKFTPISEAYRKMHREFHENSQKMLFESIYDGNRLLKRLQSGDVVKALNLCVSVAEIRRFYDFALIDKDSGACLVSLLQHYPCISQLECYLTDSGALVLSSIFQRKDHHVIDLTVKNLVPKTGRTENLEWKYVHPLTSQGCKYLFNTFQRHSVQLQKLTIINSNLEQSALVDLKSWLETNTCLTHLTLSETPSDANSLTDETIDNPVRIGEVIGVSSSLTTVDLSSCNLTHHAQIDKIFAEGGKSALSSLDISNNYLSSPDPSNSRFFKQLQSNTTLTVLNCSGIQSVNEPMTH